MPKASAHSTSERLSLSVIENLNLSENPKSQILHSLPWTTAETTTHQDHVIAHVIGSAVLGHFVYDESLYVFLDIGFIWRIYLNLEMGLLPGALAIHELDASDEIKQQLRNERDLLLAGSTTSEFRCISPAPVECRIQEVNCFVDGDKHLLVLKGEGNELEIESSLSTACIDLREHRN